MGELREGEAILGDRCSHGKTWAEECPDCALVSAKGLVERWGKAVDEARKVISDAGETAKTDDEVRP